MGETPPLEPSSLLPVPALPAVSGVALKPVLPPPPQPPPPLDDEDEDDDDELLDVLVVRGRGGHTICGPCTVLRVAASTAAIHSPRDSSIVAPARTGSTQANSSGLPA